MTWSNLQRCLTGWRLIKAMAVLLASGMLTLACLPAVAQPAPVPAMGTRIVLLGTAGGPLMRKYRAQPATLLVVNGQPYLFDCGEGTVRQLALAGFQPSQINRVFLTHLHLDHTAGLGALIALDWVTAAPARMQVYGPPGTKALTAAAVAANVIAETLHQAEMPPRPAAADLVTASDAVIMGRTLVYSDRLLRIFAIENTHYANLHLPPQSYGRPQSLSYRIETPHRVVVLTGDTGPSAALADLAKGADLLVSEVIDIDATMDLIKRNYSADASKTASLIAHMRLEHFAPDDIGDLAAKAGVKMVVLTHIVPGSDAETSTLPYAAGVRRVFHGPVVVGQDLDQF